MKPSPILKGTLDLLLLRTLELEPLHGVAIADRIRRLTRGAFDVKAGSLFPALHRMEQEGWIVGEWGQSPEGRRIKSYRLTAAGKKRLSSERANWLRTATAMTRVLEAT